MSHHPSANWRSLLIATGLFILAGLLYFYPILQGDILSQGDVTQFNGSAREIQDYRDKGRQIYWTNAMFAGMPNFGISVIDPGNILRHLPRLFTEVFSTPIGLFILLCLGFYLLMMALNIDLRIAIAASLSFAFSSYFIVVLAAGHNAKFHAMAYLPAILAAMLWVYRDGKWLLGGSLMALFVGLEINAKHPQMFYYFVFVAIAVGIGEFVRLLRAGQLSHFIKGTGVLLIAALLGVGTQFSYLQRTLDYSTYSTRGQSELSAQATEAEDGLDVDYITNWSYGVAETFSWLIPNYKGGVSQAIGPDNPALEKVDRRFQQAIAGQSQYFGDQPFVGGPVYLGALVMLFALFGFFYLKNGLRIPLLLALILMTMLSWGKNFPGLTHFFIDYVPLYDKFRAVSSIMVIPSFILPLMGAMTLNQMVADPETLKASGPWAKWPQKKLFYVLAGVLVGFCALSFIAPDTFNSFLSERESLELPQQLSQAGLNQAQADQFIASLSDARSAIFTRDAGRSLLLLALATALFFLWQRGSVKSQAFLVSVGLLAVIDLWMVDRRYLGEENFVKPRQEKVNPSPADQAILRDPDPYYRVLNLTVSPFNDATTSFFHQSVGGYSGIKMKNFQEVVDYHLQAEIQALSGRLRSQELNPQSLFAATPMLNMLNTKYLIINRQGRPLQNPQALGNAWFVQEIVGAADADEEIQKLGNIQPGRTAVLRADQNKALKRESLPTGRGRIALQSYDPEKLVYQVQAEQEGLAVFSEVYYPEGWRLLKDGEEIPLLRANYLLRAAVLPAGSYTLEMRFEKDFATANRISLVAGLLLLGLLITAVLRERKRKAA